MKKFLIERKRYIVGGIVLAGAVMAVPVLLGALAAAWG